MSHLSWGELVKRQQEAANHVQLGSVWEHYRTRDRYQVIGHCIMEATDEAGILYRSLQHPEVIFPRSYSEWTEEIEIEGEIVPRFHEII